jgi:hypothetical protein
VKSVEVLNLPDENDSSGSESGEESDNEESWLSKYNDLIKLEVVDHMTTFGPFIDREENQRLGIFFRKWRNPNFKIYQFNVSMEGMKEVHMNQ